MCLRAMQRAPFAGTGLLRITPGLQLVGALLAFVVIALFSAIHSDLGRPLTIGESPGFGWARASASALLWLVAAYLGLAATLQHLAIRRSLLRYPRWLPAFMFAELVASGMLAMAVLGWWNAGLAVGHALLQASLLLQVLVTLGRSRPCEPAPELLDLNTHGHGRFLMFLFLLAAAPALLDPSRHRLYGYVRLDSTLEWLMTHVLPPVMSGVTGLWFGLGIIGLLASLRVVRRRLDHRSESARLVAVLPFVCISGFYTAIFLTSVSYAMEWELDRLQLKAALLPLAVLLGGGGGVVSYIAFRWLVARAPRSTEASLIGMLALSLGTLLVFPIWLCGRPSRIIRGSWRLILSSSLLATLGLEYYVLASGLFNPWFTVFSYLKGALLKTMSVVAAGILVLVWDELFPARPRRPATAGVWPVIAVATIILGGFLPFAALEHVRTAKAAILNFGELSMVDATYARVLSDVLGIGRWVRLGQAPPSGASDPWPPPWRLEKTRPSRLPRDFNLIVIVVDALRGDAFRSAGYHRDLTPFLDAWAKEDAVAFRRAYSQGGGTFAALPFLVGGRSRFTRYDPDLHRDNVYFKIAQAEGISRVMIVRDWPRAIFPPDLPIIQLGHSRPSPNQRSDSAGEVFGWAQEAIEGLADGERFFAFLVLLDVHNDLWKKPEGANFGDGPRDLYDNNLSYLDGAFQRFVAWLKQTGRYERTVIVFTSDHGEQFWEHGASLHGHTLYEEDLRIPLLLRAPGLPGRIENIPVVAADMVPTVAELAGYSIDPGYDDPHMGMSLLPLLLGGERRRYLTRDVVGMASFKRRYFLYRNWEWKLVYSADFDLLELFNTARDPEERQNLLRERSELAAKLERELFGYLARVGRTPYQPLLSPGLAGD